MDTCFSRPLVQDGLSHVHRLVSWDELRRRSFTWEDLVSLTRRFRIVWLSRDVFVYKYDPADRRSISGTLRNREEYADYACLFGLAEGDPTDTICICSVTPDEEPTGECRELFQLIGQKSTPRVTVKGSGEERFAVAEEGGDGESGSRFRLPLSPETLACMLGSSLGCELFGLVRLFFTQQQCQQLSMFGGPLNVNGCSFADDGRSICEAVESGRGPSDVSICHSRIDGLSLSKAIRNTPSLKYLHLCSVPSLFPLCLRPLGQNRSLVRLAVRLDVSTRFTEKEWSDMFRAIQNHEKLRYFKFFDKGSSDLEDTDAARAARGQVILEMLQRHNKVLEEILIEPFNLVDRQFFDEQIQPHLTANLYRRRIKALVEKPGGCDQRQLFSRALSHTEVNRNPSAMFLLLSGFHDLLSRLYPAPESQDDIMDLVSDTTVSGKKRPRPQLSS